MIDPFILAQQDSLSDMNKVQNLLETRDDMIRDTRGVNVDIFHNLGVQISNYLQKLKTNYTDMEAAMKQVTNNPGNFDISNTELNNRFNFLTNMGKKLKEYDDTLKKQNSHQFPQYLPNTQGFPTIDDNERLGDQQSQLYQEHAEQIDAIADNVTAGLLLGRAINAELADQEHIIAALGDDVENASDAMKRVTNQINALMEAEGKTPTCLVFILSIVFIILLFFVI